MSGNLRTCLWSRIKQNPKKKKKWNHPGLVNVVINLQLNEANLVLIHIYNIKQDYIHLNVVKCKYVIQNRWQLNSLKIFTNLFPPFLSLPKSHSGPMATPLPPLHSKIVFTIFCLPQSSDTLDDTGDESKDTEHDEEN